METSLIFCTSEVICDLIKEFEHWRKSKNITFIDVILTAVEMNLLKFLLITFYISYIYIHTYIYIYIYLYIYIYIYTFKCFKNIFTKNPNKLL